MHCTPEVGCFFKIVKIQLFDCFIAQLVKKLQQWSLYEVIEDILPFVLNTKRPLSDIWLVSYKQNSFGCFLKKWKFWIFLKTPKTVLLISQQPNIAQRPFVFKTNVRISSITSYKPNWTDSNCHDYICPSNICHGNIVHIKNIPAVTEHWPNFGQTLKESSWNHL